MADHNVDWDGWDWDKCAEEACIGVRLPTCATCWAHAGDADVDKALKRLGENGRLDARGVQITPGLLGRMLAAVSDEGHGHLELTDPQFEKATFLGTANFGEATFKGEAKFMGVTFQRDAWFPGVTFQGDALFFRATFQGIAGFDTATFGETAWFLEATFQGTAPFRGAAFQGTAGFDSVTFQGDTWFHGAVFQRDAGFRGAVFQRDAGFDRAAFQQAQRIGPMLVRKGLRLDQAVFHERTQIEVAAAAVCCQWAKFPTGVQLRLRWAQIVLDDADLAAPSILAGVPAFPDLGEGRWARAMARLQVTGARAGQARLLSVRRADVAGLTVADVDLRACRFAGAHHLDQLRLEECHFPTTPKDWRWTTRQTIAEEHHWRGTRLHPKGPDTTTAAVGPDATGRGAGWYQPAERPPVCLEVEPATPAQIAALYRALRKGREDNKDEPGAADFYYGEMELRRHDPTKPKAERLVLFCYWLLSGYALRASRALAWLFGVLTVATFLLAARGLEQPAAGWSLPARLGMAALVAVEGAVFRASEQQLTYTGQLVQAVLRFAGPILLGLTVLSIRGRVKR